MNPGSHMDASCDGQIAAATTGNGFASLLHIHMGSSESGVSSCEFLVGIRNGNIDPPTPKKSHEAL